MRILFLSSWFPYPPDNGARIRTYHLLRALAERHEVHLISLLQEDSNAEGAYSDARLCATHSVHRSGWFDRSTWKSKLGLFSTRPRSVVDTFDSRVRDAATEAVKTLQPDVIVASALGVAEYVPHRLGVPTVLDEHNCEYAVLKRACSNGTGRAQRARYTLGWKKFARWEAGMCRRFSAVSVVSEQDKNVLLEVVPDLRAVQVVPNGVDVDYYGAASREPDPNTLLYNGALTFGANLEAVRHYVDTIYPLLRRPLPNIRLLVTGRTDGVDLEGLNDCPGVELAGYLSDIRTALGRASAAIVPLRNGGGTRLKILEAMAAGVPVVSTSVGAEGIECSDLTHLLLADDPLQFAQAVTRVIADPDLRTRLTANARRLVEERYSWKRIGSEFVEMVEAAARLGKDR